MTKITLPHFEVVNLIAKHLADILLIFEIMFEILHLGFELSDFSVFGFVGSI